MSTQRPKLPRIALGLAVSIPLVLAACSPIPVAEESADVEDRPAMADRFEVAEAERRANEEVARRQAEERAEAERLAAEERAAAQAAEAERLAEQAEAERRAAQEEARRMAEQAEAERRAAEAEARRLAEQEREAAEAVAGAAVAEAEAERVAAEQEARRLAEQAEAERVAAEAQARRLAEQEREAAEEAARLAAAAAEAASQPAPVSAAVDDGPGVASEAGDFIIPRTPENIARLGRDLTPMGSARAGSADGRIPEWTGGLTENDWPAGYQPGDRHLDPFAADEPLYVITGQNYQEYADRLSAGQIATFQRYPDTYRIRVYPTRRSASFPQRIYDMTIQNARTGRLVANGEGVADVAEGFPFPLPQNAYEVMWNHKLKFKGTGGTRYSNQAAPTARGSFQLVRLREELLGLYYIEGNTIEDTNNILLYFFQEVESPARLAGNILLVHESLNQILQPRQAWIYNPGQRRVRRAPNVAYDNPGTASDGLRTNDMTDMFNGAMDRFTWEIVGKREMYIPYNSYRVHSGDLTPEDIVQPGHLNPDLLRYQLHRVWIVDARLRPEFRHINPRRTFYFDEDSYQIALIDHYDARGELWRASEAHTINYYDVPTYWSTIEVHMDLQSGRFIANGLDNQDPVNTFNVPLSPSAYTPQALRTRGRR
ncbi:MAG: DUF1329 domain-containing protein [Wenzhouxiangellaceae bacterium]|nr:MAG: DUF1329 domain-containing protein [Wenzhouxiangellaceae bacterium]